MAQKRKPGQPHKGWKDVARKTKERSPWRPISTAPPPGTAILAYRPLAKQTSDEEIVVTFTTKSATTSPQGVKHYTDRWCHPTHWMPLPAPPQG